MDDLEEWNRYVVPILREVYRAEREGGSHRVNEIIADLDFRAQVGVARRIKAEGLMNGVYVPSAGAGEPPSFAGDLLPAGARAIRQWPADEVQEALLSVLRDALDRAPEKDKPKIRRAMSKVGQFASQAATAVLVKVLTEQM